MTREERNVLVFVALGVVLGSLPVRDGPTGSDAAAAGDARAPAATVEADLFPIDLNRAGPELLQQLPGIGPAKALAIVERRRKHGLFRTIEELEEVHGIGPRTVERLRDLVTTGARASERARDRERDQGVDGAPGDASARERGPQRGSARPGQEAGQVQR